MFMRSGRHAMAGAFVFLLLGMYAALSALLVLLSAQAYTGCAQRAAQASERRILVSYPLNKLRAANQGNVYVTEENGIPVLAMREEYDDVVYETRIYCYDGMLREMFYSPDEEEEFDPEMGEALTEADSFVPMIEDGLVTFDAEASGQHYRGTYRLRG